MGLNVGGNTGFFQDDFQSTYPKPWNNSDINVRDDRTIDAIVG